MAEDYRVPTGPIQATPVVFLGTAEQQRLLGEALVGVELGSYDTTILDWLAGWDGSTVVVVASLIERARQAGYAEGRRDAGGTA